MQVSSAHADVGGSIGIGAELAHESDSVDRSTIKRAYPVHVRPVRPWPSDDSASMQDPVKDRWLAGHAARPATEYAHPVTHVRIDSNFSLGDAPPATRWQPREVRTARMVLRALRPSDRAAFIELFDRSEAHLSPWSPAPEDTGRTPGRAGLDAFFDRSLARSDDAHSTGAAVRLVGFVPDGRIAGTFNLNNIVRGVGQMADAGWLVSADFAGQGFATEGVAALLALAFEPISTGVGLHRVQAGIMPRNHRSLRVAQKCGMRQEGLAQRYIRIAGVWEDHLLFAKTIEEHPSSRS